MFILKREIQKEFTSAWLYLLVIMLGMRLGACRRVRLWADILNVDLEPFHYSAILTGPVDLDGPCWLVTGMGLKG